MSEGVGAVGFAGQRAVVARIVGTLQVLQAGLMGASALASLAFGEPYVAGAFVLAGVLTGVVGAGARACCRAAPDPDLKHAMVAAGLGWFVTAAFGALPFFLSARLLPPAAVASYVPAGAGYASSLRYFRDPLHALFEGMSGWTTTGLTMAVHEPSLPLGLLWWRTLIQWVGGMGVILLTLTVLWQAGGATTYNLYRSEAREEKLRPSTGGSIRELWRLYAGLTIAAFAYLAAGLFALRPSIPARVVLWDALTHAMTAISTGGFSVLDDSVASFHSPAVELLFVPVMAAGAVAYPVYYALVRDRDVGAVLRDPQVRILAVALPVGAGVLTALLAGRYGLAAAARQAVFQYVSALSTTGYQTAPLGQWPARAVVFVVFGAMVVGGSAGATVGGVKLLRAYLIAKGIR